MTVAPPVGDRYLPLAGLRILDLSRLIVGGLVTQKLADLGAEVVKVEPDTGDYLRDIPPMIGDDGVWHNLLNRNKKSIELDIVDSPADRDVLLRLIAVADVVVEVSRPGSLERLGIDIVECRRLHPKLIVCSISGFGQTGEWSSLPSHGLNMDSLAGTIATQTVEGEERFVQLAYTGLSQEAGGSAAALAIAAAAAGVRGGGEGVWIDISCWDGLIDMNRAAISYLAWCGRTPQHDYAHMWGSMHSIYITSDRKPFFMAVIEKKFWERFCHALDRTDLLDRWHGEGGVDYGDEALRPELEAIMSSRTAAAWSEFFLEHGLPGSQLLTLPEVIESKHFRERDMLEFGDGPIPNVTSPIRWIDQPGERPGRDAKPPPEIGADTDEVLASWLGSTDR